jgi:LPS sulfotransferase NodH
MFRDLVALPDATSEIEKKFLILCTPRSGSTLFADTLSNTGKIGICEEWFNYEYFAAYSKVIRDNFSLQEYFNFLGNKTVGNTGILSLKLHIAQSVIAKQDFDFDLFSLGFDHIIYLYRKDKIAQSVSLAKAIKSNKFRHNEKAKEKEEITFHDISYALGVILEQDKFFQDNLSHTIGAKYAYEDFSCLDPPHWSYNEVLEALDKEPQDTFSTTMKKQGNKYSEDMTREFKKYILGERYESC